MYSGNKENSTVILIKNIFIYIVENIFKIL